MSASISTLPKLLSNEDDLPYYSVLMTFPLNLFLFFNTFAIRATPSQLQTKDDTFNAILAYHGTVTYIVYYTSSHSQSLFRKHTTILLRYTITTSQHKPNK